VSLSANWLCNRALGTMVDLKSARVCDTGVCLLSKVYVYLPKKNCSLSSPNKVVLVQKNVHNIGSISNIIIWVRIYLQKNADCFVSKMKIMLSESCRLLQKLELSCSAVQKFLMLERLSERRVEWGGGECGAG
jgi:hypothetical protein